MNNIVLVFLDHKVKVDFWPVILLVYLYKTEVELKLISLISLTIFEQYIWVVRANRAQLHTIQI